MGQTAQSNTIEMNANVSVVTVNVNELNASVKRLSEGINILCKLQKTELIIKFSKRENKREEKDILGKCQPKEG